MADDNNPKKAEPRIRIITNGPYIVTGGLPLGTDIIVSSQFGHGLKWEKGDGFPHKDTYALCRCGLSKNKPSKPPSTVPKPHPASPICPKPKSMRARP
jgi:hypothetical protein